MMDSLNVEGASWSCCFRLLVGEMRRSCVCFCGVAEAMAMAYDHEYNGTAYLYCHYSHFWYFHRCCFVLHEVKFEQG